MISAPSIFPSNASLPAQPLARAGQAPSWFDAAPASGAARISADLNLAARGLSVEQHAAQVLANLVVAQDAR